MIKKYPNRRLYCTTSRGYVTLAQLRGRLLCGERVYAVPARAARGDSCVDVTAETLARLILEEALAGRIGTDALCTLLSRCDVPAVHQKSG